MNLLRAVLQAIERGVDLRNHSLADLSGFLELLDLSLVHAFEEALLVAVLGI